MLEVKETITLLEKYYQCKGGARDKIFKSLEKLHGEIQELLKIVNILYIEELWMEPISCDELCVYVSYSTPRFSCHGIEVCDNVRIFKDSIGDLTPSDVKTIREQLKDLRETVLATANQVLNENIHLLETFDSEDENEKES